MQIKLKPENGFTLIEVLVAIVLLVIMSAAIVTVFGSSFTNIFAAGNRNEAMAYASDIMEGLYAQPPMDSGEIGVFLVGIDGQLIASGDDIYNYDALFNFNFSLENTTLAGVNGHVVTIVRFYKNGSQHVTLSTFIRE